MTGATASLPAQSGATDASANAQSGLGGFASLIGGLAGGSGNSPLSNVSQTLTGLGDALHIDTAGISQRLPKAIQTIEDALPLDAIRFIEELEKAYQEVNDFLANSELVKQIHPGASLQQVALALIDDVLKLFDSHLAQLGDSLFDAETLAQIKAALQTLEQLASGAVTDAAQLLDFLAHNLLGIAADLLAGADAHLAEALKLLDPFSQISLDNLIADARTALMTAFQNLLDAIGSFDAADLSLYAPLESLLQAFHDALDLAFDALEALYAALTAAVALPAWDTLFSAYADVLDAIPLEDVPTVDDAVEAIAKMIESLLTRLGMVLSPEDLAKQISRMSASVHDLFGGSALAQVQQILIDFIGKIQKALEGIPTEQVQGAVTGMLDRVHQELTDLGIDQIGTTIKQGFQSAHDFIDDNIDAQLLGGVSDALEGALQEFQNIPIKDLGDALAAGIKSVGDVITDLESQLSGALDEVKTLLESLDSLDFKPVADEVIDEIDALKTKLAAIKPDALSDAERVAIAAGVAVLRLIDLEGLIENELKTGFAAADKVLTDAVQTVLDAWLEFRRRIGSFDGAAIAAPVTALLDQVTNAVKRINGTLATAPLQKLVDAATAQAKTLSPGAILDPLQAPYDRMLATLDRINPNVWVQPLRALHAEIDKLIDLIDIRPLMDTLEQKEKELFAKASDALAAALDAVQLPAPLDAFYAQMKTLVLAITDAIFAEPDTTLRTVSVTLNTSLKPSALFLPLDAAFDKLMKLIDTQPADKVLAALEDIRKGIGATLPVLNPANVQRRMRDAQGLLAQYSPAALPGVVTLPGLRASLDARLDLSVGNEAAKVSLRARFDLALAPIDVRLDAARVKRLVSAHEALIAALRQRINGLDQSGAQAAYQKLDTGLSKLLPPFLRQNAPLTANDVRAGLASLRPSTKARRIDLATDRFLAQLAPIQTALNTEIDGFFQEIRGAALALHPTALKAPLGAVYTTLHQKLDVIDPDAFATTLTQDIWEPLMAPLKAIDPKAIKAELDALYQDLIAKLTGAVDGMLASIRQAIDDFLGKIRKALADVIGELKAQLDAVLKGVTELLDKLDKLVVDDLFHRLLNLLANLETSFDRELDRVRNEFDAMIDAIPIKSPDRFAVAA